MIHQSAFHTAILDPAKATPEGLTDGQGRPAPRRFNVYRNNVVVSLTETLETGFPATARLLGPENFRAIAGRFLRQSPPDSPLMMRYGAVFPDFLATLEDLSPLGYLPDIARLDQALRCAYHAADHVPLAPETLSRIPPEALATARVVFAPSAHLLLSDWPIYDIYRYVLIPGAPKPRALSQPVLISRPEFDPVQSPVTPHGAPLIAALMRGETLEQAAAGADLTPCLSLLLKTQALTSIKT